MIVIASDHAGFKKKEKIKNWLEKQNAQFFDAGPEIFDAGDSYVSFAKKAIDFFTANCDVENDRLILICGSGIGMSIVANRNTKIRAVVALSKKQAVQARQHNNCNCLCIGARNTSFLRMKVIIKAFLKVDFLGGKYLDRVNSI